MTPLWLRVAVVQFAPKLGEVHANIVKARELCRGLTPGSVDLVCFPEMIFSGYMFPDAPSIAPYLEHPRTGPTSSFCAALARQLQCYVVAGFPERLDADAGPSATATATVAPTPTDPLAPLPGANAALLYDTNGHLLHTYHKSNLFPTDVTWARPGSGFTALDLPMPFGRTAVAICNDLNVDASGPGGGTWHSIERGPYELAGYCRREGVRVLVLLNSWLKEEEGEEEKGEGVDSGGAGGRGSEPMEDGRRDCDDDDGDDGSEPDWPVLNYWAMRLRPLWAKDSGLDARADTTHTGEDAQRSGSETSGETAQTNDERDRDCLVVVCNRFGHERGKTFAGSSAMFSMSPGSGKPRLLHVMGEREEGVRIWAAKIGSRAPA